MSGWRVVSGEKRGRINMNSFLDTNIIMRYFEYGYNKDDFSKRCFEYVKSEDKVLISYIIQDELKRNILRMRELFNCVIRKIKNSTYEIDYRKTSYLNKEDELITIKLYMSLKDINLGDLKRSFDEQINYLNDSLYVFLKNKVSDIEITKSELDKNILSVVRESIEDFSDCKVLTSAIQMQQDKDIFLFVTADSHFSPNEYDFLKNDFRLEKIKIPILKNLLFEI